jgi:hypothetical protein
MEAAELIDDMITTIELDIAVKNRIMLHHHTFK